MLPNSVSLVLHLLACLPHPHLCTCIPSPVPATLAEATVAMDARQVLFVARIEKTTVRMDSVRAATAAGDSVWIGLHTLVATAAVHRTLRGALPDTVAVETPLHTTACGADLREDREYLIDADGVDGATFHTTKCTWTREWRRDDPLVGLLEAASDAQGSGA